MVRRGKRGGPPAWGDSPQRVRNHGDQAWGIFMGALQVTSVRSGKASNVVNGRKRHLNQNSIAGFWDSTQTAPQLQRLVQSYLLREICLKSGLFR